MGAKVKGAVPASGASHSSAGDERRRAPRMLVDLEVDYASEDNYLFAYITDISATGIFIRTTTPEQPGTHLNLRFNARGDDAPTRGEAASTRKKLEHEVLEIEGQVIWVNPYRPGTPDNLHPGMGVRFVGLDDELRHRLLELIRRFAYLS